MSLITEEKKSLSYPTLPLTPTFALFATSTFPIMHLIFPHTPTPPQKKLHNLLFSFLLGITAVLRDIENNACKKFEGGGK